MYRFLSLSLPLIFSFSQLIDLDMLELHHEAGIPGPVSTRREHTRSWTRIKQLSEGALLALVSIGISLIALKHFCVPLLEYAYPDSHTFLLDSVVHGAYPLRGYFSTNLTSPQANVAQSDSTCADGLVLLSIGGQSVKVGGPMIIDMSGNLVWSAPGQYGDASANTSTLR